MYSYPESCCCFGYEIETDFPEISNQEISGNGDIMPEIVSQITLTADHPTTTTTTTTTIGQLTEELRAETKPGISEEESSRFLQQTTIQLTTELIIEPKTVSIYEISTEISKTASESRNQSKTEFNTQSIAETNTETIMESSTIAPEGTESTSESATLITETTAESITKMTEYIQGSTTQPTTHESVSPIETAHLPETTDESTAKSSDSTAEPTDKSTKEATESTTQTTVDLGTETPTATRISTTDSIPREEIQYSVEEGITVSSIRTTAGDMMLNTVTGKDYFLGLTTEVSAEFTGENYQHLNTVSNSELTTENNKVLRSESIIEKFSDDIYNEISQTDDYIFPDIDPA
jgi:hypothetical protein